MNARLAVLIWVVATLVILAVTLLPLSNVRGHPHWDRVAWVPFADPHAKPLEVAANLALFVPYGFGATAFAAAIAAGAQSRGGTPWPGWRFALVAVGSALLLSLSVETVQLFSHNRFSSANDVMNNTIGAALGAFWALLRR